MMSRAERGGKVELCLRFLEEKLLRRREGRTVAWTLIGCHCGHSDCSEGERRRWAAE